MYMIENKQKIIGGDTVHIIEPGDDKVTVIAMTVEKTISIRETLEGDTQEINIPFEDLSEALNSLYIDWLTR